MSLILIILVGVAVLVVVAVIISQPGSSEHDRAFDNGAAASNSARDKRMTQMPPKVCLPPIDPVHQQALNGIDAELRSLLRQNRNIEALKRVRAATGWGLKTAKAYLESLSTGNPLVSAEQILEPVTEELRSLMESNRKVEAIKRVRALTGWDLRTSKNYVERL